MHRLLKVRLHNPLHLYYVNAVLFGQMWATLAFENFDPELWDQWK